MESRRIAGVGGVVLRAAIGRGVAPNRGGEMKKSGKIQKVMHEFKEGELRSGSAKGPKVTSRKQAIAIAMSEAGKSKPKGKR